MRYSDRHLETALREYNEKVNLLEGEGNRKDLLDAYVNRGCVLSMMGMTVSAAEDFSDAIEIIAELEKSGTAVDPGYYVKAYVSRGELQTDSTAKKMADDYRAAASKLDSLTPESRYYDDRCILDMCVVCAGDLIDNGFPGDAFPFIDRGFKITVGKEDDGCRNAYLELSNLAGQAHMANDDAGKAYGFFSESVRVGRELYENKKLRDAMDLVYAYVSKGDTDEVLKKDEEYFADREAAIVLMEDLRSFGALDDEEILSGLHGEIAEAYMKKGRIAEAEKHLLKQVSYNLSGSTQYLDETDR